MRPLHYVPLLLIMALVACDDGSSPTPAPSGDTDASSVSDAVADVSPEDAATDSGPADASLDVSGDLPPTIECDPPCPAGYSCDATGACVGPLSGLVLDVSQTIVSGSITVNGQLAGAIDCNGTAARVLLSDVDSGFSQEATVDCSAAPGLGWSAYVFPGVYEVSVEGFSGTTLPTDGQQLVLEDLVVGSADETGLVLDVRTVDVSGTISLNGQPAGVLNCTGTAAEIIFTETTQGYFFTTTVGCQGSPTGLPWSMQVYPGTYSVMVTGFAGTTLPPEMPQVVHDGVDVMALGGSPLDLPFGTREVDGTITTNGQPAGVINCQGGNAAQVTFEELDRGYLFPVDIPCSSAGPGLPWSTMLFPGTYRVSVSGFNGTNLPTDGPTVVEDALDVQAASAQGLELSVMRQKVSGTIAINGQPAGVINCAGPAAAVYLTDATRGYARSTSIDCGTAAQGLPWSMSVPPGIYQVEVEGYPGTNLPTQKRQKVLDALVVADAWVTDVSLELRTLQVSGSISVNGQPAGVLDCTGTAARVRLKDAQQGYTFDADLPCATTTPGMPWELTVYPGTYEVSVFGSTGTTLPQGDAQRVLGALAVTTEWVQDLVLDVRTRDVSGTITVGGQPGGVLNCIGTAAEVVFMDPDRQYRFHEAIPCSAPQGLPWSASVYPGVYQVSVEGFFGTSLPVLGGPQRVFGRLRVD